ncbi:MAG TPA: extracellular solute-binding protein [Candidatus Paceibacterota bacterium]|nr:extracellular solute-binding protein [Verrucomicrobiota bacterium]HRY50808.1 extracellular solute-binding protein [Candidatus Paceibacterota bacterium]
MNMKRLALFGSLVIVAGLTALLLRQSRNSPAAAPAGRKPLVFFCAAGIKPPVEAVAREYEQAFGIPIQLQYGGSGTLLSNLRVTQTGDLFLAGDESYVKSARELGLMAEVIPLARQRPVITFVKGNPKNIRTLEDLRRPDVRVAMANPDAASVGRTVRDLLERTGQWTALEKSVTVFKPTVNDVANDVKIGSVDAGIVWDATARQYPELDIVSVPLFDPAAETISIGVLKSSRQPDAALRFARYLGAPDKGQIQFRKFHYEPVEGDAWAESPEILLFSGAMLRPGIEKTLREFEARENCRITTVYNGCGILVAQMRVGQRPDAYFSCDTSFMESVADLYRGPVSIVDNDLMIIVQKGNLKGIRSVQDMTQPGIRVGLPHHEKSAMGNIAWKMLLQMNLYDALGRNLKVESPTGDFLINQIRTGSLDAIIACRSNWTGVREELDAIPIDHALARMTQPFAVGRGTRFPQLMTRLREAFTTPLSRQRFEAEGFGWRYQPGSAP